MVAASVGMEVWSSGQDIDVTSSHNDRQSYTIDLDGDYIPVIPHNVKPEIREETGMDSIQPVSGWWMYEISAAAVAEITEIQAMESGKKLVSSYKEVIDKRRRFDKTLKLQKRSKLLESLDAQKFAAGA